MNNNFYAEPSNDTILCRNCNQCYQYKAEHYLKACLNCGHEDEYEWGRVEEDWWYDPLDMPRAIHPQLPPKLLHPEKPFKPEPTELFLSNEQYKDMLEFIEKEDERWAVET